MAGNRLCRSWAPALSLLAAAGACLLAIAPGLDDWLWEGHDHVSAALRVHMLVRLWQTAGFHYPSWLPEAAVGYGYPFFTFYPPLGYFVAGLVGWVLPISIGLAVRLSFWLSLALAGLAAWVYAWQVLARLAPGPRAAWAFAAAVFYMLAPYHLVDLYLRAALSQSWIWFTPPLLFAGIELSRRRGGWGAVAVALAAAATLLAHNAIALYVLPLAMLYVILTAERPAWIWATAAALGWGLALSACYWLPAFGLLPMVRGNSTVVMLPEPYALRNHAVFPIQYFMEGYGRGWSLDGVEDDFATNPGLMLMLCVVLGAARLVAGRVAAGQRRQGAVWLGLFLLLAFVMSPLMPWEWMPRTLRYIQFPWRLMVLAIFAAIALVLHTVPPWGGRALPLIAGGLAVWFGIRGLYGELYLPVNPPGGDAALTDMLHEQNVKAEGILGTLGNEYLPNEVDLNYLDPNYLNTHPVPAGRIEPLHPRLQTLLYRHEGRRYEWTTDAPAEARAKLHLFHFPGWRLWIDGRAAPDRLRPAEDGLIEVTVPPGRHRVVLAYDAPPLARPARALSCIALVLALAAAAWLKWFLRRRPFRVIRGLNLAPLRGGRPWGVHLLLLGALLLVGELSLRLLVATRTGYDLMNLPEEAAPAPHGSFTLPEILFRTAGEPGQGSNPCYQLRPGLRGEFLGRTLQTDGAGRRVLLRGDAPASRTLSFAVLGGDAAFGWEVAREDHFAARLAPDLARALGVDRVEPLVVAVPGHTPAQQVELFVRQTLAENPAFVLFQFDLNATRWAWCVRRPAAACRVLLLARPIDLIRGRLALTALAGSPPTDPPDAAVDLTGWEGAGNALQYLAEACRERAVPVFLFATAPPAWGGSSPLEDGRLDRLRDLCRNAGIHYLPVLEWVEGVVASGAMEPASVMVDRAPQAHPNRLGHLLLLSALAPELTDGLAQAGLTAAESSPAPELRRQYQREFEQAASEGLYAVEDWGRPVQWTRERVSRLYFPEGRRLIQRYHIGTRDISPTNPVIVQMHVPGTEEVRRIYWRGNQEDALAFDLGEPWPPAVRVEIRVNRTFREGKWGRLLGIALFEPVYE